jgi:hypothetical protein
MLHSRNSAEWRFLLAFESRRGHLVELLEERFGVPVEHMPASVKELERRIDDEFILQHGEDWKWIFVDTDASFEQVRHGIATFLLEIRTLVRILRIPINEAFDLEPDELEKKMLEGIILERVPLQQAICSLRQIGVMEQVGDAPAHPVWIKLTAMCSET